jgi:hypothetical protein
MRELKFQTSSYSNAEGNCVGITGINQDGQRYVGDSKNNYADYFGASSEAIGHFVLALRDEEFASVEA